MNHRFWQVVGVSLAVLASERRWIAAGAALALTSWVVGLAYVWAI